MKLLTYQPFFSNDICNQKSTHKLKENDYIEEKKKNNNIVKIEYIPPTYNKFCEVDYYSSINQRKIKKIYVDVKIMSSETKELLDNFNNDIEELTVNNSLILGLLNLNKFTRITKLICSSNEIMHIQNLPLSLEYLDISFNKLKNLDISYLPRLKYIKCAYNELKQINFTNSIEFMDCSNNELSGKLIGLENLINLHTLILSNNKLNEINVEKLIKLKKLEIINNNFKNIMHISNSIEYLDCSYNLKIDLNHGLPEQLSILNCSNCELNELNNLPMNLKELICSNNKIVNLNNLPHGLKKLFCRNNFLKNLDYLPDSLEVVFVGSNPKLLNLDNLNVELKELECTECLQITALQNLPNNLTYFSFGFLNKCVDIPIILSNKLKHLDIQLISSKYYYFEKISNFIEQIEVSFTNRYYLDIRCYDEIKSYNDYIYKILQMMPNLKKINFNHKSTFIENEILNHCNNNNIVVLFFNLPNFEI